MRKAKPMNLTITKYTRIRVTAVVMMAVLKDSGPFSWPIRTRAH